MKTRRIILTFATAFFLFAGLNNVVAQDMKKSDMSMAERHEMMKEKMIKELDLNDEQQEQFAEIFEDHQKQMEELHAQMKEIHAQKKEMRSEFHSRMEDILDEEQMAKLKDMKENHHKKACCAKGDKKEGCHGDKKGHHHRDMK